MGIGGGELLIILLIVLLLLGPSKIPEIAKTIGKGMNEFKRAADEIKNEINSQTNEMAKENSNIKTTITEEVRSLKNSISTSYKEEDEAPIKSEATTTKKGDGKSNPIADLSEGSGI